MKIKPVIILARPQMPENIGFVARIMKNFALDDLRIVNPRDGWPNRKAGIVAVGGAKIIENAKIYESMQDALDGIEDVYACSARLRNINKKCYNLKEHIEDVKTSLNENSKVGLMFGSETSGLTNDELVLAKKIITISANDEYPVLNLSHAVGLTVYEYFNLDGINSHEIKYKPKKTSAKELGFFLDDLFLKLKSSDYFLDGSREEKLFQSVSNVFSRAELSGQEVKSLIGISKALYNFKEEK
jgi:tRNA/rRNA methyltransferase